MSEERFEYEVKRQAWQDKEYKTKKYTKPKYDRSYIGNFSIKEEIKASQDYIEIVKQHLLVSEQKVNMCKEVIDWHSQRVERLLESLKDIKRQKKSPSDEEGD